MHRWRRLTFVLLLLTGTVGCDQATKQLAIAGLRDAPGQSFLGGLFRLDYAENAGAFLSLGGNLSHAGRFWLLTAGVGALLLGMTLYVLLNRRLGYLHSTALALLVGGGVSNWLDRVLNEGRVVDFMVLGAGPVRTGVFNVADVAIMVGIGLMLLANRTTKPAGSMDAPAS